MDVLPSGNIFHELQVVHDTGYFDGKVSPEEHWQQVCDVIKIINFNALNLLFTRENSRLIYTYRQGKYIDGSLSGM